MMYQLTRKTEHRHSSTTCQTLACLSLLLTTLISPITSAQNFETVVPMESWASYKTVNYSGNPVFLHLRTGYERAVVFPEPVTLYSVNNRLVSETYLGLLPACAVEISDDVMGFKPRQRFKPQTVSVRGADSGFVYELLVSSSPVGSRQPIEVRR